MNAWWEDEGECKDGGMVGMLRLEESVGLGVVEGGGGGRERDVVFVGAELI